jgi:hypothetical protein
MMVDFGEHSVRENLRRVRERVDKLLNQCGQMLETMLILDADKTLSVDDTGSLFWEIFREKLDAKIRPAGCPLIELFRSKMGYSYIAFRQAVLMYEQMDVDGAFFQVCLEVAEKVRWHPVFVSLLQRILEQKHTDAVIAGLKQIWELILKKAGLSGVKVISGGRISDRLVVNAEVKAAVATQFKEHGLKTIAMGDSTLDLDMLKKAYRAVVVVGGGTSGGSK